MTNPPEQPSEAITDEMIDAGVRAWLNAGGHHCDSADLVGPIYLAMQRAAAPTPVQDDDAEFLRKEATHWMGEHRRRLERIAARLSTDTALVGAAFHEALERYPDAHSALVFFWGASGLGLREPTEEQLQWARDNLASRGGDNGK